MLTQIIPNPQIQASANTNGNLLKTFSASYVIGFVTAKYRSIVKKVKLYEEATAKLQSKYVEIHNLK